MFWRRILNVSHVIFAAHLQGPGGYGSPTPSNLLKKAFAKILICCKCRVVETSKPYMRESQFINVSRILKVLHIKLLAHLYGPRGNGVREPAQANISETTIANNFHSIANVSTCRLVLHAKRPFINDKILFDNTPHCFYIFSGWCKMNSCRFLKYFSLEIQHWKATSLCVPSFHTK